ncbi:MAG: GFA family protein [Gammaproteobacteria bacterium]
MSELNGGCLCGSIRYTASPQPAFTAVCHCSACKRFTGSAFAYLAVYPDSEFTVTGSPRSFTTQGDSGEDISRYFCAECGSSIYETAAIRPGFVLVNGGTLDNPNAVTPVMESFCDNKLGWAKLDEAMQKFPGMPT